MMNIHSGEQGFTLIELVISLAMTSLIVIGSMSLLWIGSNSFERQHIQAELQYSARKAQEVLKKDIRESSNIKISNDKELVLITDRTVLYRVNTNQNNRTELLRNGVPTAENIIMLKYTLTPDKIVNYEITAKKNQIEYTLKGSCRPQNENISWIAGQGSTGDN
ncbi:hypothetical protein SYNTR_0345 [Candidatus Syntrophocurvum alkaliphilum]|uniref:Prepilin-type N-terminal cleavage/methylation domain-containing protein n=1 Tax=Candidatus Syntrophocurvum alkaliphilum TaxID=2293317 RepID=A0A6I6DEG2_9FIRM|nr:prepilin-type N-terminal cleavage/methylation domain-containing protein [Candidatus Syntrophocurvum alkaliphilum]QGT98938.1 hypothetical protein SYNTR_0345 [Candidatus Syntrophocurvum alkaliphilum]